MFYNTLRRISTRRNHRRIRWRNLLSMRTFVCFDFTSEMRRIFSSRKSRNDSYFFVTKKFAKHFKPIRIINFFRREFADDFASWKSAFKQKNSKYKIVILYIFIYYQYCRPFIIGFYQDYINPGMHHTESERTPNKTIGYPFIIVPRLFCV